MAKRVGPQRDDWIEIGVVELDGAEKMQFRHRITGATLFMAPGMHPMDNPNAIVASDIAGEELEAFEKFEESPAERVAAMLSKAGGMASASIHVYKILENGKLGYAAKMSPEEFETGWNDMIRTRFGAGEYEIRLYAINAETKRTSVAGRQIVTILPDASPKNDPQNNDAVSQAIKEMSVQIAALATRPQPDPHASMMQTFALMKAMREATGETAQKESPLSMMKELVSVIIGARELREAIEPAPIADDPLTAIAPKALEVIGAAMARSQQPQALPAVGIPATMQANPQPLPAPTAQGDDVISPDDPAAQFKSAIRSVNGLALFSSPETAAQLIYEQADDDLIALLKQPNWWTVLCQFGADSKRAEWFQKTRDEILALDEEDSAPEVTPIQPSNGNAGVAR